MAGGVALRALACAAAARPARWWPAAAAGGGWTVATGGSSSQQLRSVATADGGGGGASPSSAAAAPPPPRASPPLTVGFIGIGNMGSGMASRLLAAGHKVIVCDRSPAAVAALEAKGAASAESPRAMGETPGVAAVISMLPSTEHVADAYEGPDGLLRADGLVPRLLVDCSTISPLFTQELAGRVARARLAPQPQPPPGAPPPAPDGAPWLLDAPVSGGVAAARDGSLSFMVGGPAGAVAAARPLLAAMGARVTHLGGHGLGQAAKLCNNLCLAVQMAGVSEALALGAALGLDPKALAGVMAGSTARCWSLTEYPPVPGLHPDAPSSRDYTGGFSAQLMIKDLRLAMALAASAGAPAPMATTAQQLYRQVADAASVAAGGRPVDFSAIYKYVHSARPGV